jgi:hypothetical protein
MSNKTPDLAEKILFWEEQDKINQLLIPRVLELHKSVQALVENNKMGSEAIAAIESKLAVEKVSLHEVLNSQNLLITRTTQANQETKSQVDDLIVQIKAHISENELWRSSINNEIKESVYLLEKSVESKVSDTLNDFNVAISNFNNTRNEIDSLTKANKKHSIKIIICLFFIIVLFLLSFVAIGLSLKLFEF